MMAALLAAAVGASPVPAGAPLPLPGETELGLAPTVQVSARPEVVRLGVDQRVELQLRAPAGPLRVSASQGRVVDLREESAGRWTAVWLPPRARVPSVAIVVARAPGAVGFVALPLWGEGRAQVRTRPGAVVEVTIGDSTFGPLNADAKGLASVPVVVPPGVDYATQGARRIDLRVPRTKVLSIAPLEEAVECDRDRQIDVAVAVVARDGAPRASAPLELTVSRGALGPTRALSAGLYAARWSIPAGAPGTATLRASLRGEGEASEWTMRLRPGAAARIELSQPTASLEAGGPAVQLTARAFDRLGNPSEEPLRFSVDAGGTVAARAAGPGAWELSLEPPGLLRGATSLRVRAAPEGRPEPSATSQVALLPAAPAEVEVRADSAAVRADGHSAVELRLTVRDRFGNRVDAPPRVTATAGSVTPPAAEDGAFRTTYVAPLLDEPASAVVDVRAGDALGRALLSLLPGARPLALSARVGWLTDLRGLNAGLLGLGSSFRTDRFVLSLDAAWSRTSSGGLATASDSLQARDDFLLASATAAVRFHLGDRVQLWAGGGPLLAAVSARVRVDRPGQPSSQTTSRGAVPGGELVFGVERSFARGVPFLEARLFATRRFSLPNLEGSLLGATLSAGFRYEVPWR